ncbi:3-beta-hydroxycholanate 3-dehydrogenase (NAD(+)) 2 [Arthrobacter sp. 9AX]|uniref:SDR family NAD(P)-dependent oxidoreductase n=1 Tax=Arthrobacter sp. 9AX TaxID=2653131 RepID=UPI0012F3BCB5|nr:SDR family NAD(P)-dependent oxidoreductase [Arthrobacter sp. 9AX]VXC23434.1 3-beta-hydroxycholanate 3-dehydrogenase (NAD(+)) 2 [Arthrobacter sp. 9AX]
MPVWQENITPNRFEGQTVIVTGAASGIGLATALRVAREGGRVIASDLSEEGLDKLVAEYGELDFMPVTGDISKEDAVQRVVSAAEGRIDALANVAGIMDIFQPVHELDDATWERVLDVNLTSMMRLMRAVVPAMLASGHGSIVNVSSEAGLRGSAAGAAYTVSKHAVIGLTRSSAVMYGRRGIRVNAVAPGGTKTNIHAEFKSQLAAEVLGPFMQVNVPAIAEAGELAAAITFLLSRDGSNINGVVLASDNGWNAI